MTGTPALSMDGVHPCSHSNSEKTAGKACKKAVRISKREDNQLDRASRTVQVLVSDSLILLSTKRMTKTKEEILRLTSTVCVCVCVCVCISMCVSASARAISTLGQ